MKDRRSRRSQDRAEALALFLESHRRLLRVRGLSVTTGEGAVLASAGALPAPAASVATWQLRVGRLDVTVTSVGGRLSHDVGAGVRRILSN
jgi:hypothetical protein